MDNQQVRPFELGWLAGIIEGEGTIGLYYRHDHKVYTPTVSVTNTDYAIIERTAEIIKAAKVGVLVQGHKMTVLNPKWADRKDVIVAGHKRTSKLLPLLIPYMVGVKKYKAMAVAAFSLSRLAQPGGGRRRGGVPYSPRERRLVELALNLNGNPNEYTLDVIREITMMYSELQSKVAEAAETAARP